jgi:hypothetical protein
MSNQIITPPVPQKIQNVLNDVDNTNQMLAVSGTSQLGQIGVDSSSAEIKIDIRTTIPRGGLDLPRSTFGLPYYPDNYKYVKPQSWSPNWDGNMLLEDPSGWVIPRPPSGNTTLFFTQFHSTGIVSGHYFWISDPSQFVKTNLPQLAEGCDSLKYALVAFSALIFSWKWNPQARILAFQYYRLAVKGLQEMLLRLPDGYSDVVATVLQLSTFEVPAPLPFPFPSRIPLMPPIPSPFLPKQFPPLLSHQSSHSHRLSHTPTRCLVGVFNLCLYVY